ncbi:hypothetical protein GCM10009119_37270 [Algoriphagus jejuensis]|uniref:Signal transduction histidine kinase internal region domain-containing protein n=1 Tax=Algoriphagus jejuensis TaxID=419934 RepID=A0ABN1N4V0_9BACT
MTPLPGIKPIFRILLPLLTGTLVYLSILLAFDTVESMLDDFFTRELFFCLAVSLLLLEVNRRLLRLFEKKLVYSSNFGKYAILLISTSIGACILLVSGLLIGYFSWFENMTEIAIYTTELKIFNGIFLFVTLLFQSHFLGFYLIQKRFERALEKENREEATLDRNVNLFHYMFNPRFLMTGLESILLKLQEQQMEQADEAIILLSGIYRHSLKTQEELIPLEEELAAMQDMATFLNEFGSKHIQLGDLSIPEGFLLVPRTLTKLVEAIAYSQLSSASLPLKITVEIHKDQLNVSFPSNFSLTADEQLYDTIKEVQQQYLWLEKQLTWNANGSFFIHIPLEKLFQPPADNSKSTLSISSNPT